MKLIADNYEEEHIHAQHHPHHAHHLHPANVHHRSLPRGPPHANHRPPMDQVNIKVHGHTWQSVQSSGLFTEVVILPALIFVLLKMILFGIFRLHHKSVVVRLSGIKFPLAPRLSLLPQTHYLLPSQSNSYQLDKEPKGKAAK